MFKYIIVLLLCIVPTVAMADLVLIVDAPVAGGSACAGDSIFEYHAENSPDVTVGTPSGCADTDTVGTETSITYAGTDKYDGTYSIDFDGTGDKIEFDLGGTLDAEGKIDFWVCPDSTSNTEILRLHYDNNNWVGFSFTATDEIKFAYKSTAGGEISVSTTDCNVAIGQDCSNVANWTQIVGQWRQGANDPSMVLNCTGATEQTTNTDLVDMANTPNIIRLGDSGGWVYDGHMDNINIDDTHQIP